MSKRERRNHDTDRREQAARASKRRAGLVAMLAVAVLIVLAGAAVVLVQAPWMAAHRGQLIGVVGLALLAVVCAMPVVVEFNRHPRHLSGPGRNPEQGTGPWDLGE